MKPEVALSSDYTLLIRETAFETGIDENLFLAICIHESSLDPLAIRFEPNWKYFHFCREHAEHLGISVDTETALQSCSFGLCQVMGAVVREIGFKGPLTQLIADPKTCLKHGAIHLKKFLHQYGNELDAISAYNQGSSRRNPDGAYKNQIYVDVVNQKLMKLREVN